MAKGLAAADLRTSTEEELEVKLTEAKIELFNLRFQAATGQLEGHGRLRAARKEFARIYTVTPQRGAGIVVVEEEAGGEGAGSRSVPRLPQGARGPRGQRQDGQDRRRPGRGPGQAPQVRQGHPPDEEVQGTRWRERLRRRRPGAADGDPAAVSDEALAGRGDPREGQVTAGARGSSPGLTQCGWPAVLAASR